MKDRRIGWDEAVAFIDREDKTRACWARLVLGMEWEDASLYDVMLNLDHISIPSAVTSIVRMSLLDEFKMNLEPTIRVPGKFQERYQCGLPWIHGRGSGHGS
jgi:hypothetical protein